MLLAIPAVVLLSQCTGGGGCVGPNSWMMSLMIFPSLQLRKSALSSASAVEVTMNHRIPQKEFIAPLRMIGSCL